MKTLETSPSYREGRDEMNLADFPISALQRTQKTDGAGKKLDRLELTASRYDPATRGRVRQRITLTSTARDGLPTPADEHVILALLYVAKHGDDFASDTVHFAPSQLFAIMGWAPNGRSYTRLRDVLRRLKSLTIRYENAWWDMAGRAYEEEVATGIVSGYRIARQVSGPRKATTALQSWVTWSQQFHASLRAGNLKRLNLEVFFKLSTPTAQRLYRFLDKRFYTTPELSLDLIELACGHVGLTEVSNVAILKRRLAPAIAELEQIGFLQPATVAQRYVKVKAGQWRVCFKAALAPSASEGERSPKRQRGLVSGPEAPASPSERSADGLAGASGADSSPGAQALAQAFYRLWSPGALTQPGPRDLAQASEVLAAHPTTAEGLVPFLVQVTRKEWPECRSFSGAAQKYLAAAVKLHQQQQARAANQQEVRHQQEQARREGASQRQAGDALLQAWGALTPAEQEDIRQAVWQRVGRGVPAAFVQRLCLAEMGRRLGGET